MKNKTSNNTLHKMHHTTSANITRDPCRSRLLLLPAELRNAILFSALVSAGPVVAYIEHSLVPSRDTLHRFVPCRRARPGLPGVFGACRQLREESTAVYFGNNTFSFVMVYGRPPAPRLWFLLRGHSLTKHLRHIIITFNVDDPKPTPFGPQFMATGAKLELRISAEGQLVAGSGGRIVTRTNKIVQNSLTLCSCAEEPGLEEDLRRVASSVYGKDGTADASLARAVAYLELLTLPPYTGLERWPTRICDRCDKPRENTFFVDNF
ncbi:hypothetical protein LTS10_002792 [Elasticomyces elasticus]|nr:hypothetical protein LTS10_002792 [Elasticomyces elasticus]